MHTTKRPVGDIRIAIRCEEKETPLVDMAYFNSLMCKGIIRLYGPHLVNES
jgi:hypothetical protein